MNLFVESACLILVAFVASGVAFFPNNIGIDISNEDYTIESITRTSILNVTAVYFQRRLGNSSSVSFDSLDPLTESSLIRAFYGGQVSAKKFKGNILSIATSAMKFCRQDNRDALFLDEGIAEGLALLLSLRTDLRRILEEPANNTKNFDVIRELIGSVICVQSSFYSNTNWVETHGTNLYGDLGISTNNIISLADLSLATCTDCPLVNTSYNCNANLIAGVGLTSGYTSVKPTASTSGAGKCSHGGILDKTQDLPATGGINKETSNPVYSPHYYLHEEAGQSAVEATKELFLSPENGILDLLGDADFNILMGLGTGVSLCVVMDTTGSMWDDINAVKQQTQALVSGRSGTVHLPDNFIFVPFADPATGPVQESSTGTGFLQILDGVVPSGGGDCPELALQGILLGIQASSEFSKVFIFTDADAKDGDLFDRVIASALTKKIILEFLLTGECSEEEAAYPNLYSTIASKTGGNVFYSSKSDIGKASGVIDLLSGADQVSLLRLTTNGKRDYTIPVDDTLRDFSVFISSDSGVYLPGMSLTSPSGEVMVTEIQTTNLVAYQANNASSGEWVFHLDSPVPGLEIEVVGSSSLNVHLQMFEKTSGGQAFPVEGKPVAGTEVTFGVSILGSTGSGNFSTLTLLDGNGNVINNVPLNYDKEGFLTASATVPNQAFRVLLTGQNAAGQTIERLVEEFYEPQDFKFELNEPTPIRVTPDVPLEIPYTLYNYGSAGENFTITITDANGLLNATFSVTASASSNKSGILLLDLRGMNITDYSELGSLSVIISGTSSSGTSTANYNSFRVYATDEPAITAADIVVDYVLPVPPVVTEPVTPKTGETKQAVQDPTVLIVCIVAGVVGVAGVISVITVKKWHRVCGKVGPYSYPKPKPTVPKANLRPNFSFS